MTPMLINTKLAQPFSPVKSSNPATLSTLSNSMIHHKVQHTIHRIIYKSRDRSAPSPYGVSPSQRVLSPQLLLKKHTQVRDCLAEVVKLSIAQREVVFRLLRLWAYYGKVYPKESSVTDDPGCSKATFWRTIRLLEKRGLVTVINRYVIRPQAQISNLYRFDKLLLIIARYLAEHGQAFREKWLAPYLQLPGRDFWGMLASCHENRAGPGVLVYEVP